jgi:type IV pilus assembly protein PilV
MKSPLLLSRQQTGFTLLEVMVALVIISIGLLGIIGMQMTSLKNSNSSAYRSIAVWQLQDMAEKIRSNRTRAAAREYEVGIGETETPATATPVITAEVAAWKANLANTLPSGKGSIVTIATNGSITLTVEWDDTQSGGTTNMAFSTQVEL